ncbi:sensor histidine kinase [Candidatus Enterococcus murrayae]|uniref:histidine kinase n=1 Tax=Candidatus Enterococcus murrayae TaxID=2815321 RepID=A0ABS3HJP0_9ENTE|nr:HAMP domain-containing sensor histidine kinase [Enterococcus sp. MJM16]MBO0453149.1 HAMP domain-containing histidine kinase [Enterococcus sp. MJM16]
MDQRRSKKIILLYVLFSLLFVTLVMVQNLRMRSELLQDQQATLALLNKEESFSEAKLIEGFDEPKTADLIAEGKKLETKYGLLGKMSLAHLLNTFILRNFAVFSLGWLLFSLLFYWLLRKKRTLHHQLEEKTNEYEETLAYNELMLRRSQREEGDLKSSITDITHQLKTPVASLKLSLDIALSEQYEEQERKKFAEQAEVQINKLGLMLDGLGKISQLETELIQLHPQKVSLQQLLTQAVNSVIMKAVEKEIELEVELSEESFVLVDKKWTLEALGNVLENAIKYSPKKTTVVVQTSLLITYVLVEVKDQGPGIPKEEQNKIYQRFYRGKNSASVEGSGVGLYLTRKIIEEQGGTVLVKRRQPRGSNFQLTLPLA